MRGVWCFEQKRVASGSRRTDTFAQAILGGPLNNQVPHHLTRERESRAAKGVERGAGRVSGAHAALDIAWPVRELEYWSGKNKQTRRRRRRRRRKASVVGVGAVFMRASERASEYARGGENVKQARVFSIAVLLLTNLPGLVEEGGRGFFGRTEGLGAVAFARGEATRLGQGVVKNRFLANLSWLSVASSALFFFDRIGGCFWNGHFYALFFFLSLHPFL